MKKWLVFLMIAALLAVPFAGIAAEKAAPDIQQKQEKRFNESDWSDDEDDENFDEDEWQDDDDDWLDNDDDDDDWLDDDDDDEWDDDEDWDDDDDDDDDWIDDEDGSDIDWPDDEEEDWLDDDDEDIEWEEEDPIDDIVTIDEKKPSADDKKREKLLRQNLQLGEAAIGSMAKVLFVGFVYTRPNGNAATLGKTIVNQQYKILDFQQNSVNSAYFKVQFGDEEGWIAINKVQVTKKSTSTVKGCTIHQGGQAEVLYGGSYVRSGPGTGYSKIITVDRHERYKILGCEIDSAGKHWLKLQVGSRQGYILASRCEIRE